MFRAMSPPFDRFEPMATQWRTANALALAHASNLAYSDRPNQVLAKLEEWGFSTDGCRVFSVSTAQVLAAANDEMIIIAFRGTEPTDLADWLVNAEIIQKPWKIFFGEPDLGRVHQGFMRNTSFVWEQLSQFVAGARTNRKSLWITGHSLGGAMALIAGAAFALSKRQPVNGIYTFGQPRTGNHAFVVNCNRRFKTAIFRVVNNEDIVPHVPPAFIPFLLIPPHGPIFYQHAGVLLQFDAAGKLRTDLELWWRTSLRHLRPRHQTNAKLHAAPPGFAPLDDHSLEAYIQKLQAWLDAGNP
jgi:triacylglycerol lipase